MLSRRSFVAASAAAPFAFVPSASAGPIGDAVPAVAKITLGFIGVGTMGRGHLGSFLGRPDVEVVAVCDVVKERIDNAKQTVEKRYADRVKSGVYKGVKTYGDYRELIAHKGLDAVLIATPDHWHHLAVVHAARAGKHIYCEKPLTHNVAEGRQIVDEVKKAKVTFQTGSQQRSEFGGHFRKAVEYIWNGRIGRLKTVRIGIGAPNRPCDLKGEEKPDGTDWDTWLGPAPEREYSSVLCPKGVHGHFPAWRAYQEYAGGQVADMGAHHFDIAQWAMNMDNSGPVEIVPPEKKGADRGLKFEYPYGVVMYHNVFEKDKDGKEIKADCVFEGTEGTILVSRGGISSLPDKILKEPLGAKDKRVYPSTDHKKNWLDCIRSGKATICPAEIGHRTATVCHLANIAYRLNRALKWNPVLEKFIDDSAANKELTREPRGNWKV
jgi:predicted dehydrogenase